MARIAATEHPYTKQASRFAIGIGVAILLIWVWLIATGDIPELEPRPLGVWLHILGEVLTAIVLIVAGWGLATGKSWARKLYLLAIGMLLIAVIHAMAWYGDRGEGWFVFFFLAVAVAAVYFAMRAEE
jgi:CDP-diglyceride synthetase